MSGSVAVMGCVHNVILKKFLNIVSLNVILESNCGRCSFIGGRGFRIVVFDLVL